MKLFQSTFFLLLGIASCKAQNSSTIIKYCSFNGSESFPAYSKNICERLYYNDNENIAQVAYAQNNWQVLDYIYKDKADGKLNLSHFKPIYNEKRREIVGYKLEKKEHEEKKENSIILVDKYNLAETYTKDLELLLSQSPSKQSNTFVFKTGIVPMILVQYGIPTEQTLYSFNYVIENKLIIRDSFFFEQYTLVRQFNYNSNNMLDEVSIISKNKKDNAILKFKENYALSQ